MAKTEVYSWRLSSARRAALQAEARAAGRTIGEVLDHLTDDWLMARRVNNDPEQRRLHAAAAKAIGSISGGDPHRSENVEQEMYRLLKRRYSG